MVKLNKKLSQYKARCKFKNIEFSISDKYAKKLMLGECFMCGEKGTFENPLGIDRFFNKDCYHKANCVSCCWECNRAKNNMSFPKFISWFKRFNPEYTAYKEIVSKYYSWMSKQEALSRYT